MTSEPYVGSLNCFVAPVANHRPHHTISPRQGPPLQRCGWSRLGGQSPPVARSRRAKHVPQLVAKRISLSGLRVGNSERDVSGDKWPSFPLAVPWVGARAVLHSCRWRCPDCPFAGSGHWAREVLLVPVSVGASGAHAHRQFENVVARGLPAIHENGSGAQWGSSAASVASGSCSPTHESGNKGVGL